MEKRTPEQILTQYVKGNIARDFDQSDRDYYTVSISTALRAMKEYGTQEVKPLQERIEELEVCVKQQNEALKLAYNTISNTLQNKSQQ